MINWRMRATRVAGCLIITLGLIIAGQKPAQAQMGVVTSEVTVSFTYNGPVGNLQLTGYAIPNALVTVLIEGAVAGTDIADNNAYFDKIITGLDPGAVDVSLYAQDGNGRVTPTITVPDVIIISGETVSLGGFILPPTINVVKPVLKRPDSQIVEGYARPSKTITNFYYNNGWAKQTNTNADGSWLVTVNDIFHLGNYTTNAIVSGEMGSQSQPSQTLPFQVVLSADLNVDNYVNLTDFSILMYSYGQNPPPNWAADINDEGNVNLSDFSIMMYYWTG